MPGIKQQYFRHTAELLFVKNTLFSNTVANSSSQAKKVLGGNKVLLPHWHFQFLQGAAV